MKSITAQKKKKDETRGRWLLPEGEKKKHVQIFLKQKEIERFGGREAVQRLLIAFMEGASVDPVTGVISFISLPPIKTK